jgi:dolichyl-phosphate mannosyltransferase polypeptide 2 regulatory subunit
MLSDKLLGLLLLTFAVSVFGYYTLWLATPFLATGSPVLRYFLPFEYAIKIPLALVAIGVVGIVALGSIVMLSERFRSKNK